MKINALLFAMIALVLVACNLITPTQTVSPATAPAAPAAIQQKQAGPPQGMSPQGAAPQGNPPDTVFEGNTYIVTNPTSGAALYVAVYYPGSWDGQSRLPALVFVPGGNGDSMSFVRGGPAGDSTVSVTNDAGYVAIVFDPDGRGKSTGTEDYDGFIQQDGLAEVFRNAATWPGIDPANIGMVTNSYGITMGAGALARYPDLPVKFLIDWEGPADRDDTGGCDSANLGHLKDVASCDDESFWAEREASTFIGQVRVPYQRIQSVKDHVQPDYAHTVLMVNNAVNGSAPWVRLNDEVPNQTYTLNAMPRMLPDSMDRQKDQLVIKYARELFGH